MISRAAVLLVISQIVFLISGFGVNAGLARFLGPVDYGTFGLVLSILVVIELFVITGIPEAIQKYGGENPGAMAKLIKETIGWQIGYCFMVFVFLWFLSPFVARFFDDHKITYLLRLAGIDVIFYGLYKYFLGVQNGLHKFVKYTILGITYSVSRLIIILGLVWFGFSVRGALIGNFLASLIGLIVALMITKLPKLETELDGISYSSFVVQNVIYFVGLNMLFSIDLWFVKYHLSDLEVGYYVSASSFAKLTYFISIGLHAVLLPSLSLAIRNREKFRIREITQDSLRYLLIFLVIICIIVIENSQDILNFFYGPDFINATKILSVLISGISLITLMAIINTIMMANDKMKSCFIIVVSLLVLDIILNIIFVPKYGVIGAAVATTLTGGAGLVFSVMYIFDKIKSLIFSPLMFKIAGVGFVIWLISRWISFDVILKSALITGIYFLLLWLTSVINMVDIRRLKDSFLSSSL